MKWWYWLIIIVAITGVLVAYYLGYGQAQTPQPSASATVFQRATQPYSSPTASPTPAAPMPPMKLKHP